MISLNTLNAPIVQQISEDLWANRAFDDTSVKFGTHGEDTLRKIFGYRAIAHFARNKNGGFLKWLPPSIILTVAQVDSLD